MARVARTPASPAASPSTNAGSASDPAMHFSTQDEMLQYARDVLARVEPQLPRLFKTIPRMTVGVRPIPAGSRGVDGIELHSGTADGTRPGWFNMNTYRPTDQTKYTIEALVLHETVPGHHLQVGLARELEGLPEFRTRVPCGGVLRRAGRSMPNRSASSSGVYRDPATRFGQLASEQFRAVRLVVDTGMHAMGWSRDRAAAVLRRARAVAVAGRSRSLHRAAGSGARLQARRAGDQEAAAESRAGARLPVRRPRLPRCRASQRRAAARPAGAASGCVHCQAGRRRSPDDRLPRSDRRDSFDLVQEHEK